MFNFFNSLNFSIELYTSSLRTCRNRESGGFFSFWNFEFPLGDSIDRLIWCLVNCLLNQLWGRSVSLFEFFPLLFEVVGKIRKLNNDRTHTLKSVPVNISSRINFILRCCPRKRTWLFRSKEHKTPELVVLRMPSGRSRSSSRITHSPTSQFCPVSLEHEPPIAIDVPARFPRRTPWRPYASNETDVDAMPIRIKGVLLMFWGNPRTRQYLIGRHAGWFVIQHDFQSPFAHLSIPFLSFIPHSSWVIFPGKQLHNILVKIPHFNSRSFFTRNFVCDRHWESPSVILFFSPLFDIHIHDEPTFISRGVDLEFPSKSEERALHSNPKLADLRVWGESFRPPKAKRIILGNIKRYASTVVRDGETTRSDLHVNPVAFKTVMHRHRIGSVHRIIDQVENCTINTDVAHEHVHKEALRGARVRLDLIRHTLSPVAARRIAVPTAYAKSGGTAFPTCMKPRHLVRSTRNQSGSDWRRAASRTVMQRGKA